MFVGLSTCFVRTANITHSSELAVENEYVNKTIYGVFKTG